MKQSSQSVDQGRVPHTGVFFPPKTARVYPKLTVNAPNDKYEREADTMADRVMRMPNTPVNNIQRKCSACEDEVQRVPIMRQAQGGGFEAPAGISSELQSSKGGGNRLPENTLARMNQGFGTDFSNVRVHTGSQAANMSQNIQAKAFTHGSDIYFNKGAYQPGTNGGDRLLAHELTHVVQQGGDSRIKRQNQIQRKKKEDKQEGEVNYMIPGVVIPLPHPSLKSGQWNMVDRKASPTNPQRSFWKASVYNAKNNNHHAYKTIAQRHAFYKFAHAYLNRVKGAIKSKWFKAAAIVTSEEAVGAADGINLNVLSDYAEIFLRKGNEFLFKYNMKNFSYLMSGKEIPGMEKLRGKGLDNKLVEYEQKLVKIYIELFRKAVKNLSFKSVDEIIKEVNNSFALSESDNVVHNIAGWFSPDEVDKVIKEKFTDKGIKFNFAKYNHRVTLGQGMIENLYKK